MRIAELWERYRPALADMGRIVVSGAIDETPISMSLRPFYLRSQSLIGVRTGNRAQMTALWDDVWAGLRLNDRFYTAMPWTQMREAHAEVERAIAPGQIVLQVA